jgi:hypothetical protein
VAMAGDRGASADVEDTSIASSSFNIFFLPPNLNPLDGGLLTRTTTDV